MAHTARLSTLLFAAMLACLSAPVAHATLVPLEGISSVASGGTHTCVLTTGGGVKCWGYNGNAALGNPSVTTGSRLTPLDVSGLASGVSAIAAGELHKCALTAAGGVKCWGGNASGQLGDGTTTDRSAPVDVTGLTSGVAAVATGYSFSCALTNAGAVMCWGNNGNGQLGNGTTTTSSVPVNVSGLASGVVAIAGGGFHTCALITGGAVKCWGRNVEGQIGDSTNTQRPAPADVTGLASGATALAAGRFHTCAVVGGGLKCWGDNTRFQLANGSSNRNFPVDAGSLTSGVAKVTAGLFYTCALTTGGGVKCWGSNLYGEVGNNVFLDSSIPADVVGLATGVVAVSAGHFHACALTTAGRVRCWGSNAAGQVGDGTLQQRLVPATVVGFAGTVASIAARGSRSCAVMSSDPYCWGDNFNGGVGDGGTTNGFIATEVTGFPFNVASVTVGTDHTCALTTTGAARCWGFNNAGQVGDGSNTQRLSQVQVSGLASGVIAISAGYSHTCALTTGGGVKCWGRNAEGQLGNGSITASNVPVDVTGLTSGVAAISSGGYHTCALLSGGGLRCWGYNLSGQLGNNSTANSLTQVAVSGLASGVASVSAGGFHTCAVTTGGAAKCWGYNANGTLGDNTIVNRSTPVDVIGLSAGVASLAAGDAHNCALTTSGGVKCWGYNNSGLLGEYSAINRRTPVDVIDLPSGVTAIAAGSFHNCALLSGGSVKCWGFAGEGQIGDNVSASRGVPVEVVVVDNTILPTISSSQTHTLALDADGKVYAWGSDSHGQLGLGRAINRSTPAQLTGIPSMSRVSLSQHALAVDAFGQVWAWGENGCGQLGPRAETVTSKPARVLGMTGVTEVASGGCFSIARKSDGTVWGWGLVPGYGTDTSPRALAGIANATAIAAGSTHALVRRGDGVVLAFGDNSRAQLGQGGTGAVQGAVQVLTGVATVAAGDDASMARVGGQIQFWGTRSDGSVVASPAVLPATAFASLSISIGKSVALAALADGSVVTLPAPYAAWQTVSGFAGIGAVEAGVEFQIGIAAGQLYAAGSNTAGQLGQGNTNTAFGALPIPGMANVTQVAAGGVNPSVLALKNDGTLWFWGADTLGESGDGAAVGSSVPRLVPIAPKVVQIATGDRFSLAFDVNGNVWGWGDNAGAALDGTLVNRSTPAIVAGAFHAHQIAAGGPGLALYLRTDGTVTRSGTLAGAATNSGPVAVIGLSSIAAVAAGTSAYALRNDNALFSFGGNASGELGNGTTVTSGSPVQVSGVTGTIAGIAAGRNRAAAITSDGKAWTWGAGPLGNGSAAATSSSTGVSVTGITDATEVSLGLLGALVRRQGGALSAWGDVGLSDAASVNPLFPYPVAFHEPVKRARAGANNALGYIVGNTGLAWGFGKYLTVSNTTAAVGDGTYVARERPVVVLAEGGLGNIDTNNWFFDLEPASAETVPTASTPKMLGVAQISGSEGGLAFDATIKYRSEDFNKTVSNYVFGLVPPAFFDAVKRFAAPGMSSKARLEAKAVKNGGFVLAQLTPSGWTDVQGQLIAYSSGVANASGGATNILGGVPASQIAGARFCIGYGETSGSMLSFNALREVLLLPGASQNTSGVPCVLSGVYVDGPPGSRVGTNAVFKASVVGLTPTGQVQFKDGAQALSSPLSIGASNDAVASAQLTTNALALGEHSIGATYLGDSQNAPIGAEIPLRHTVVSAASQVNLVGPTSSDQFSQATFEATVIGLNPTGTVQFKDGGVNIGGAVPLGEGRAVLRTSALPLGDHNITAVYSGDVNNSPPAPSNVVVHRVVTVFNSQVTLTSSALDSVQGTSITLTATVTSVGAPPTGSVTFFDGATMLGTANLVNGVATLVVSNLAAGGHSITAMYSGDPNSPVTSTAIVQQVAVPAIFSMSPASAIAFGGQLKGATSGPRTVTITNAGGSPLTVSSVAAAGPFTQTNNCTTLAASASCTIAVRFAPVTEGALNGSVTIQSSLGPQVVTLSGTGSPSLAGHYYSAILRRAPDAPGLAFWEAEALRMSSIGANVNETWFAMAQFFFFSAEYLGFNRSDSEFVTDLYTTFFNRAPDGGGLNFWVANIQQGMPREVLLASFMFSAEFGVFTQALYGNTAARAEVDVVMDFYRGLLSRAPDPDGFTAWVNNFRTAQCAGTGVAVVNMVEAISGGFAGSGEYTGKNRTNAQYVGDLYNAFLRRGGDLGGVQFWINELNTAARTRENLRQQFIASAEFQGRVANIIGQGCLP